MEAQEWDQKGALAKKAFRMSQAWALCTEQNFGGGCPAMLTLGDYTHPVR